jgi:hypothetical protein
MLLRWLRLHEAALTLSLDQGAARPGVDAGTAQSSVLGPGPKTSRAAAQLRDQPVPELCVRAAITVSLRRPRRQERCRQGSHLRSRDTRGLPRQPRRRLRVGIARRRFGQSRTWPCVSIPHRVPAVTWTRPLSRGPAGRRDTRIRTARPRDRTRRRALLPRGTRSGAGEPLRTTATGEGGSRPRPLRAASKALVRLNHRVRAFSGRKPPSPQLQGRRWMRARAGSPRRAIGKSWSFLTRPCYGGLDIDQLPRRGSVRRQGLRRRRRKDPCEPPEGIDALSRCVPDPRRRVGGSCRGLRGGQHRVQGRRRSHLEADGLEPVHRADWNCCQRLCGIRRNAAGDPAGALSPSPSGPWHRPWRSACRAVQPRDPPGSQVPRAPPRRTVYG